MPRAEVVKAGWYWQDSRVRVGQIVDASAEQIAAWGDYVRPIGEVPEPEAVENADADPVAVVEAADAPRPKRRKGK